MTRSNLAVALIATLLPICRAANAQGADTVATTPPVVFLEKAYFAFGTPTGKHLLFEGQPTVHYFFINGMGGEKWQADGGLKFTVPLSELFVARMSLDNTPSQSGAPIQSEPVLTPTYKIGIRPQAIYLWRPVSHPERYWLAGLTAGVMHYSNGQHGCTYLGFTRDNTTGKCVVSNATVAAQTIANTDDGDFSTTYWTEAVNVRLGELKDPFSPMKRQVTVGLELQQHPIDMAPGGTNIEQARQFGNQQLGLMIEGEYRNPYGWTGVARVANEYTRRWGSGATPLTANSLEGSYIFDRFNHLGLFLRYHTGFDYYNIHFQDTRSFMAFGVMWDVGRLDHLNSNIANPH